MSAYIVEKATITKAISTLKGLNAFEEIAEDFSLTKASPGAWSELGQILWNANVDAVNQRYNDKEKYEVFFFQENLCRRVEGYKAIRSLLYQMSEGNVPDTQCYKALDKWSNYIARVIVSELDEYKEAQWGR